MHRVPAALCAIAVAGTLLSAQEGRLPSEPRTSFGNSITGAFDGWFHRTADERVFLVGYFNRNTAEALDIPIGPDNRIEPGGPDLGQPTHFLPGRHVGVFTVRVPDRFTATDTLTWTLVANGQTTRIPLRVRDDYYVSPLGSDALGNTPPVIRLAERGPAIVGPVAAVRGATAIAATAGTAVPLGIWADDDARYTSGTNAPLRNPPPPVAITWSKYRGPGPVTFANTRPEPRVSRGGEVAVPLSGWGSTTATFSTPGEYVLHALVTDYSGPGGNGEVCCWTTTMVRVTVSPPASDGAVARR